MRKNWKTFYDHFQCQLVSTSDKEICVLMGDFNVKVGIDAEPNSGIEHFGLDRRNEAGKRLAKF